MKIFKYIVILCFSFFVVLFTLTAYPWVLISIGYTLMEDPPSPEVTYGEFPIRVEYEVDGKVKVIEDTVICEFDGFKRTGENIKKRSWKTSLKSGNERLTLLKPSENIEVYFYHSYPEYYMDDMGNNYNAKKPPIILEYIPYTILKDNVERGGSDMSLEETWEKYKIKIISFKYSDPIKNTFQ